MATSSVGFFYANVTYRGNRAVVLVAEDPKQGWKLMNAGSVRWWLNKPDAYQGIWRRSSTSFNNLIECTNSNGTQVVFNLGNIEFPPDINNNAGWFHKIFSFGEYWKANDPSLPKIRTGSDGANWTPVITSSLLQDVVKKFDQIQEEIKQVAIQAGIDTVSILDPTPFTSFVGSGYALRRGDYLGCAVSLLCAIPLIGELAKVGKVAAVEAKLTKLTQELTFFKRAIEESTVATKEARLTGSVIDPAIQGTTAVAKRTTAFKDVTKGSDLAHVAEQGGMSTKDATALRDFSMDNEAVSVVRYTSKESLARRMDPLNTGKPCELADFHTAHDNSMFSGYIVIKEDQMAKFTTTDAKGEIWLKFDKNPSLKGYKVMAGKCPKTGDRLIAKDGRSFYSDYDFMGVYHAKNGHAYEDFKVLNDDKGIVSFMQNMFRGSGYGNKVKHGMQDFFIRWMEVAGPKGGPGARMAVQGRQPKLDEMFIVFQPTGKTSILNLQQLRAFYDTYKMHWPYDAFKQMRAKL